MALLDETGTNGLKVGGKAIKCFSCPFCFYPGETPVGAVVDVVEIGGEETHNCGSCRARFKVTEFYSSDGAYGACCNWMPYIDPSELTETDETLELTT